ncbi:MAG TPA: phosphoribosylamine--glycine ligase [Acidimicrobiales bacterium]|nr:phosphoribosylamine--glycine ligase [Acidimicrobiales bacterium]
MKVLVVGAGGREHTLASVLARTADDVVVCPGNAGIPGSTGPGVDPVDIPADLVVIGPDAEVVAGLADRVRARGRAVFAPGAEGGRIEGSKQWMKELLVEAGVPTARYGSFTDPDEAIAFLDTLGDLFVVKTDGLAAGKGVLVTTDRSEAVDDVRAKLAGEAFGDAGRRVVIEEGLLGPELSVLAVCDGRDAVALAPSQDHKRVGDGDTGPNTGGMGAYSPVPGVGDDVVGEVMDTAVLPTLRALRTRGIDYRGVLYGGLMLTPDGLKVIEYNARFGDPEAQVVLPRMTSDLTALLAGAAAGRLPSEPPTFAAEAAVTLACCVEGYPGTARTGDRIDGLAEALAVEGVELFFAGVTAVEDEPGALLTGGGRVLHVTALGPDLAAARQRAYEAASRISWPGMFYRSDIAAVTVADQLGARG